MKYTNTIINAIRSYTNRAFIGGYHRGEFDTNDLPYTDKLTEVFIEIRGSRYNDGFYWIDDEGKVAGLVDEVFEGYVIWLNIPIDIGTLKDIDKQLSTIGQSGGVRREQLGDYSYTLNSIGTNDVVGGVPRGMLSSLNHYRVLPGGIHKEYENAGVI